MVVVVVRTPANQHKLSQRMTSLTTTSTRLAY